MPGFAFTVFGATAAVCAFGLSTLLAICTGGVSFFFGADASLCARGPHARAIAPTHSAGIRKRELIGNRDPGPTVGAPRCERRCSQTCGSRTYQLITEESTSSWRRK